MTDPEVVAGHWRRLGPRSRAFLLACLEGERPRGREYERVVARLLKSRLYRYNRLTPLGREVAEHGAGMTCAPSPQENGPGGE